VNRSAAWARAGAVMLAVLAVDQITKVIARADIAPGERIDVLPFLDFVYVRNDGIAFGALGGQAIVIVLVAAAIVGILAYFVLNGTKRLVWLPTGLLLGGALGNIIDRVRDGAVTDFLKIPHWPAFNVADIAITVGVITLVFVLDANRGR